MLDLLFYIQLFFKICLVFITTIFIWCITHILLLVISWVRSYFYNIHNNEIKNLDLRNNKEKDGKRLIFCAIKAQPQKSVWFGHMWVAWEEAPPLAKGEKEAGFYAKCKAKAAKSLIFSIISPIAMIKGQEPIEGIMKDDKGLYRHWEIEVLVDELDYQKAIMVDNKWRNQKQYSMRPSFNGRTITCRDYVFEIAEAIGLKAKTQNWAEFPPQSFHNFMKLNGISN